VKAVGYTRLSQESDRSILSQKEDIQEYCRKHGLRLVKIFDDGQHSSGFNNDRPEYTRMKQLLGEGEIQSVVVRDRARLGRDFDERMQFIIDLRQESIQLHTTEDGVIDLEDPYSVAVEGIHSASDDKKKREEIKKAKKEIRKRLEKGYYQGCPPFGLNFDQNKQYLVPDQDFETVMKVFDLRERGHTYEEIVEQTDVGSIPTVSRILKRRDLYEEKAEMDRQ
jgi:DNA invertase Pin-like site-specific DNA recombinase